MRLFSAPWGSRGDAADYAVAAELSSTTISYTSRIGNIRSHRFGELSRARSCNAVVVVRQRHTREEPRSFAERCQSLFYAPSVKVLRSQCRQRRPRTELVRCLLGRGSGKLGVRQSVEECEEEEEEGVGERRFWTQTPPSSGSFPHFLRGRSVLTSLRIFKFPT